MNMFFQKLTEPTVMRLAYNIAQNCLSLRTILYSVNILSLVDPDRTWPELMIFLFNQGDDDELMLNVLRCQLTY